MRVNIEFLSTAPAPPGPPGPPPPGAPMTANLLPNAEQQFLDDNGAPLAGGFVYMYEPGTTVPKDTWLDPYQSVANTNPILLDAGGRAIIWGVGGYRQVVLDSNGVQVWDQLTNDSGLLQIQSQIDTLNSEVAALQAAIGPIPAEITTLQGDVATINGEITTLQGDVTTLQSQVAAIPAIPTAQLLGGNAGSYVGISVGSGLSLAGGVLSATGGGSSGNVGGQVFGSSGTFTVPAEVVKATLVGGGGGGAGGGGGGSGGYGIVWLTGLTVGSTINVVVGNGGSSGDQSTPGGTGGNTSISAGSAPISSY